MFPWRSAFGLQGAHGHIDYYANGGADQPGCPQSIFAGQHTHTHSLTHTPSPPLPPPLPVLPPGKAYFVCDHQRSVVLFLCALNRTCSLTGYPCSSYGDFLEGRCLRCESFRPAPCPVLGRRDSETRRSTRDGLYYFIYL